MAKAKENDLLTTKSDENNNVDVGDLNEKDQKVYDRTMGLKGEEFGENDRGFFEKLSDMWKYDEGIKETFWPDKKSDSEEINSQLVQLVHGSTLFCNKGSHKRKLNVPISHGAFLTGFSEAQEEDCQVGDDQNITSFGVCTSSQHPAKNNTFLIGGVANFFSTEKIILKIFDEEGNFLKNVKGFECTPTIVGIWNNSYPKKQITPQGNSDSKPIITMESFLVCRCGGLIEPIEHGHLPREVEAKADE